MNNNCFFFILSVVLNTFIFSCDVIEEPFIITQEEVSDSCQAFIFSPKPNLIPSRKVLLEDYTGHRCGNCPRAAEKASELHEIYGDALIIMSVHAGFFAETNNSYPTDFRTESGNEWNNHFGNSAAGNPNGMINRTGYPNAHILQYNEWEQYIQHELTKPVAFDIKILSSYNEVNNIICIDIQTKVIIPTENDLKLTVVLIEDSIISKQTDYSSLLGYIEDYEQNHVLRKSLNGPWGMPLGEGLYLEGEYFTHRYSSELDTLWNINNMSVVAFVSESNSYEILQTELSYISP